MSTNNEIGTTQDIPDIASILKRHDVIFHCDASQSAAAHDMRRLSRHCDLISVSGHKMHGPMGIGALIVRREIQDRIEPLIYGGGQQEGLRSGTLATPLCVGLGAAAKLMIADEIDRRRELLRKRRDTFVTELERKLGSAIQVNGPMAAQERHPGNASISFHGHQAHSILMSLQPRLAASTGSACASGQPEPSHVLAAIGLSKTVAEATIRFSLGFGTTDEDVNEAVHLVIEALDRSAPSEFAAA